ncbi:IS21 family transposase [Oceanithermus sp.]|uniref:IS21 family transposase n=1 Tax=Oceanithermus sp. TaxID=2268145 RepID=UPI0025F03C3E|nr:IS21 family transposase [Oceanithermus sp.]
MQTPEDVAAMMRLHELGWGSKRIARELGCSRNTVRRYLRQGGWRPYKTPDRVRALDAHRERVLELFEQHRGNAAVVRQELKRLGVEVSLRTVEREVRPHRQKLKAAAQATVRFETRPGRQLQADFGQCSVGIGGTLTKVHLCVLTLGYSRRTFVKPWTCERRAQWLTTFEEAFAHFGGVPEELLVDNARALVDRHDARTREVVFHRTFREFCKHWGIRPRACAPYRARTKGKDERTVGYVKRNAIAGHTFDSWEHLEQHLRWWMREVADERTHGTTGEKPRVRFARDEARALQPLDGRPPYLLRRELVRRVQTDLCVEVDTNHYSVPYEHIGKEVTVQVTGGEVLIFYAGERIARHPVCTRRRQWVVDTAHLKGVVRARMDRPPATSELLRPLSVYEAIVGETA